MGLYQQIARLPKAPPPDGAFAAWVYFRTWLETKEVIRLQSLAQTLQHH